MPPACLGRALIVDDDFAACMMLQRMLTALSFRCDVAMDGAQAVRAARAAPYALVITDTLMPVQNGWDAAAEILALPPSPVEPAHNVLEGSNRPAVQRDPAAPEAAGAARLQCSGSAAASPLALAAPPIVVGVLSHEEESMRRRCLEAGMAAVLVKPVDRTVRRPPPAA